MSRGKLPLHSEAVTLRVSSDHCRSEDLRHVLPGLLGQQLAAVKVPEVAFLPPETAGFPRQHLQSATHLVLARVVAGEREHERVRSEISEKFRKILRRCASGLGDIRSLIDVRIDPQAVGPCGLWLELPETQAANGTLCDRIEQ